jgi:hypothetical protein
MSSGTLCVGGGGVAHSWSGHRPEEKSLTFARDRTPVNQCVVIHYTDYASPAPFVIVRLNMVVTEPRHSG